MTAAEAYFVQPEDEEQTGEFDQDCTDLFQNDICFSPNIRVLLLFWTIKKHLGHWDKFYA